MQKKLYQGDIIKVENIKDPVLVVSKDFFNLSEEIIGCPIKKTGPPGPLHIKIGTTEFEGYVQCENLRLIDLRIRGFSKIDRLKMADIINITDAIQGIFDHV